jgi:hypothetical protein
MATTDVQFRGISFDRARLRALLPVAVFDVAGPLAVYWLLRAAGTAEVTALIVSGILPAFGVAAGIIRHRRIDAIGALALLGIVAGTIAGLLTHSSRLVLMEGSVPTAIFGLGCLASLLTSEPLIYRIAMQMRGTGTSAGHDFEARWAQPGTQHLLRVVTLVWGITLLAEAAARVLIVETMTASSALLVIKLMPYLVIVGLLRWMAAYKSKARHAAGPSAIAGQPETAGPGPAADRSPALAGR